MTSKELVLELIKSQKKQAYRIEGWDKLEPEVEQDKDGKTVNIVLNCVCIGFAFDKKGNFLGIYNWKD